MAFHCKPPCSRLFRYNPMKEGTRPVGRKRVRCVKNKNTGFYVWRKVSSKHGPDNLVLPCTFSVFRNVLAVILILNSTMKI